MNIDIVRYDVRANRRPGPMQLGPATIADAPAACDVLRRSITELCYADHGGDPAVLGKWLSNKTVENVSRWIADNHFFVAEDDGRLLGCAAMDGAGRITLNYVAPDARFRGVSKALVGVLEEAARNLGIEECRLESTQTALRFYRALGYVHSNESYPMPLTGTPATVLQKRLRTEEVHHERSGTFIRP
jgi:N-acetylglutamate synthase-like GNAT family acetyltransferase